ARGRHRRHAGREHDGQVPLHPREAGQRPVHDLAAWQGLQPVERQLGEEDGGRQAERALTGGRQLAHTPDRGATADAGRPPPPPTAGTPGGSTEAGSPWTPGKRGSGRCTIWRPGKASSRSSDSSAKKTGAGRSNARWTAGCSSPITPTAEPSTTTVAPRPSS